VLTFNKEAYEKARAFMMSEARPLERAMFEYEFENGSARRVLEELKTFQNEDGGFGHGLEPDVRCSESSALATTIAFQTLSELNETDSDLVDKALNYLERTYQSEQKGWEIIPQAAEESPRAFWWEYGAFNDHWGNPNAEIAGYLIDYRTKLPDEWVNTVVDEAIRYLQETSDLAEMHEMLCYIRLADRLTKVQYQQVESKLDQFISNCVAANPEAREGYCAVPLQVMQSPNSRYYERFATYIPSDLDTLIEQQGEDGAWAPNWAWGRFEEQWQQAKTEWKGVITLNNLRVLRSFERLK
jgi:hypothetical protein